MRTVVLVCFALACLAVFVNQADAQWSDMGTYRTPYRRYRRFGDAYGSDYGYGVDATQDPSTQDPNQPVDCSRCGRHCLAQGLDGACDDYGQCQCGRCIFRFCKRSCKLQKRAMAAQCDDNRCECLY